MPIAASPPLDWAWYDNERALRLYEHLGYAQVGEEADGWDYLNDDGTRRRYDTVLAILEKHV